MAVVELGSAYRADASDPYASDPERHPGLKFHATKPCNAELPFELMMQNWVTPKVPRKLHSICSDD